MALDYGTWEPIDTTCLRCARAVHLPFRGLCPTCVDVLHEQYRGEARDVAAAEYVPKMNVTPNAVATKD